MAKRIPAIDSLNQKYGRITVIEIYYSNSHKNREACAKFICDCGKIGYSLLRSIRCGHTSSCGCLNDEKRKKSKFKHSIWKFSKQEFAEIIKRSQSYAEACTLMNIKPHNSTWMTLQRRCERENIDDSHIRKNAGKIKRCNPVNKRPIEYYLQQGTVLKSGMRDRLIKEGYLKNICYICGLSNEWNNQPLTLQLDHIDGDKFNNVIENLRLLCPNCHTQTPTFGSKNARVYSNAERIKIGSYKVI